MSATQPSLNAPPELRLTDAGNAETLAARLAGEARYVPLWKHWMVWRDGRWQRDVFGRLFELAREVASETFLDAALQETDESRQRYWRHARASNSLRGLSAAVELCARDPSLIAQPDQFDRDQMLLSCRNGTVDLATGQLRAHKPDDFVTKFTDIVYDPAATCPRWLQFLAEVLPDAETRDFLQRAVGYSLTGDTREQCLFILHGAGANGKTTLVETMLDLAGDYGLQTPAETLLARRGDSIPNDVAALRGARLVVASETEDGRRLAESRLKELTGGDTISARYMRAEWFQFRPACKLWLSTNHRPQVRGTDHAIWRRIRLIPFEQRFGNGGLPADPGLRDKLREELPGILAWAVEGAILWQRDGLGMPAVVEAATGGYRAEQDRLRAFLDDACEIDPHASTTAAHLFDAWCRWCDSARERPGTKQAFGRRLTEQGFKQTRTGAARNWDGIRLVE